MRTKLKYTLLLFVFLAGCNSDQLTKHAARESLKHSQPFVMLIGFAELCYAENPGMAFSLLDNSPPSFRVGFLVAVPLLMMVCVSGLIWRFRTRQFTTILPFVLILSGAAGNLLDRLRYGYVVDFIHFHVRGVFHWPIFNIADCLVFGGALVLFLQYGFRQYNQESNENL